MSVIYCDGIISSGPKRGKKCGRRTKVDGRCGFHKKKRVTKNKQVTKKTMKPHTSFYKKSIQKREIECAICYGTFKDGYSTFKCGHAFDLMCIVQIEQNTCPLCRAKIEGVPKHVSIMLEKNKKNYTIINQLREELRLIRFEHSRFSQAFLILTQFEIAQSSR